jgi:lysyl-tRNA synthetase class 1
MFWGDSIVADIKARYADKIKKGEPIIIRDEKTLSGRVHVGSLRGVAVHGIIADLLAQEGIKHTYFFELNDFDPMDGLPVYLSKEQYAEHMGKPLCNVPSPDGKAANFAEYFGAEFVGVIRELGFEPTYYRSSEVYKSGRYNAVIKTALEHAADIRRIYQEISGSQKTDEWLPLNVICPR